MSRLNDPSYEKSVIQEKILTGGEAMIELAPLFMRISEEWEEVVERSSNLICFNPNVCEMSNYCNSFSKLTSMSAIVFNTRGKRRTTKELKEVEMASIFSHENLYLRIREYMHSHQISPRGAAKGIVFLPRVDMMIIETHRRRKEGFKRVWAGTYLVVDIYVRAYRRTDRHEFDIMIDETEDTSFR